MIKKVLVIGGGAAGMMAACKASSDGAKVVLLEHNEKLGKKLFITGKGRCNVTNACDTEDFFQNVITNKKFLYSSVYTFDNGMLMDFFEEHGLRLKVERGNRVFPVSDKSSDVIKTLEKVLKQNKVEIRLQTKVKDILVEEGTAKAVVLANGETLHADKIILATGGKSYATTGSTGDGYCFAKKLGHTIVKPQPSLVPLETFSDEPKEMMGLALKNVEAKFYEKDKKKKVLYQEFGEMLFTHFGISGPIVLSASCHLHKALEKGNVCISINLKPALTEEQLEQRILREFQKSPNSFLKNVLGSLLPKSMIPVFMKRLEVSEDKVVNSVTKEERKKLITLFREFTLDIKGMRGFEEAIITKGGIKVSEVNPSTMESKLVKGLFFAGEVLDLDAVTGGFNLQIAWSTAYLAGMMD